MSVDLPKYRCHKEVRAFKIKEITHKPPGFFLAPADKSLIGVNVDHEYIHKHSPLAGGYYVLYADGYESFSPAQAFEEGYTKIE